jgi:o-succinylbenzoate---CoA ligase
MREIQLKLNGNKYIGNELLSLCYKILSSPTTARWEIELFTFIQNWLDDKDYIIQETSGTTGEQKKIHLQKKIMLHSAAITCDFFHLTESHTALLCLPVRYIAGKMMVVRAIYSGMNLVARSPEGNPLDGLNHAIDFSAMVPLQVMKGLEKQPGLKFLRNLIIGGSEMPNGLEEKLHAVTETNIYETFSMTETSSHIALRKISGKDASEYFELLDDFEITTDERSCLAIHAPFIQDDLIITNDLVKMKDTTHFKWLGRYDNMINSGGIKTSPEAVEKKLEGLFSQRFVISSISDKKLGDQIVLIIEGRELGENEMERINKEIAKRISGYSRPRKILFLDKFPLTETLKINRREIRSRLAEKYS